MNVADSSSSSNFEFWTALRMAISENNFNKFQLCITEKYFNDLSSSRLRFINETVQECLKNAEHCCEFLEILMKQLYVKHSGFNFECWQETCKSVVRQYVRKEKQFTQHTIYFLLRCNDIELIKSVYEKELLEVHCKGNCSDWYVMFVASYQERFSAHCFDSILDGFLSKFILLSKLRCPLNQKRPFLAWLCGSLHLYCDEYFLNEDEGRFKLVLIKVFEGLVLNGVLNNEEYKSLYEMLVKRNILTLISNTGSYNFPTSQSFFPLTLKNWCRLSIKRSLNVYTRKSIDKLPLPANLKRFMFFDYECENAIKFCKLKTDSPDNSDDTTKHIETQTDS